MRLERIALAVLASGRSERFGDQDKLLADLSGAPLASWAVRAATSVEVGARVAIIPSGDERRAAVFQSFGVETLPNADAAQGQSASIARAAMWAMEIEAEGLLVALADTPFITASVLECLISAIGQAPAAICTHEGVRTPPVLFHQRLFPPLTELSGDHGAKKLLAGRPDIPEVHIDERAAFDVDTPADLEKARRLALSCPGDGQSKDCE